METIHQKSCDAQGRKVRRMTMMRWRRGGHFGNIERDGEAWL
jgi:hypothetical protein